MYTVRQAAALNGVSVRTCTTTMRSAYSVHQQRLPAVTAAAIKRHAEPLSRVRAANLPTQRCPHPCGKRPERPAPQG